MFEVTLNYNLVCLVVSKVDEGNNVERREKEEELGGYLFSEGLGMAAYHDAGLGYKSLNRCMTTFNINLYYSRDYELDIAYLTYLA